MSITCGTVCGIQKHAREIQIPLGYPNPRVLWLGWFVSALRLEMRHKYLLIAIILFSVEIRYRSLHHSGTLIDLIHIIQKKLKIKQRIGFE